MAKGGKRGRGGSRGVGTRGLHVRVRTARGRKPSSTRWLERQLNDPYVQRARLEGYRGRAAYKLIELDDRFRFLRPGARVVDLGCAPGGWLQVAVARTNALGEQAGKPRGRVIGVDLREIEPVPGAEAHVLDFMAEDAEAQLMGWLDGPADVVLSDMAAAATGHRQTDHLRIMALCEAAAEFAFKVLAPGGVFVAKVLAGGAEGELQKRLKRAFREVHNVKPPASRSDSAEKYVLALGFRGAPEEGADQR
ncbi:MAG: RlmE family RNA methyltransferase [Alphaproteobacteria bacterium]|nr:MAG: RlmE family RNA methyltransferase [Alphaproteobacteria bacterium]